MQNKENIIHNLESLIQEIKENDNHDAIYRAIRRHKTLFPFYDEQFEYRLTSIEQKINRILNRPFESCLMAGPDKINIMQLMTGQGILERKKGVKHLSDWMNNPTEITITDPYFIKNSGAISEADYKNSLQGLLPYSLKKIELFVGTKTQKYQKPSIVNWFNQLCATRGIQLEVFHQEEVHDRVWLKNGNDALVVGTSFNGIGNKCTFLLNLDEDDTANFSAELRRIRSAYTCSSQV
jgi:hypothetical protein